MYIIPVPELRLDADIKNTILELVENEEHWWKRGARNDEEQTMAYWHLLRPDEKIFQMLNPLFSLDYSEFLNLNVTMELHKFQPNRELEPHKDLCRNAVIIYPIFGYEKSIFHFCEGPSNNYKKLFSITYRDTPLLMDSNKWHSMVHESDEERISLTFSFHNEYNFDTVSELYRAKRLFTCQKTKDYQFPSEEADSYGEYDVRKSPYPESF